MAGRPAAPARPAPPDTAGDHEGACDTPEEA